MNKQRKLTWLERKQIEKVAFDHPFFDAPGRVLSRKEAKEIIRLVENRKTGTQIVKEAYAKLGVPYSASIDERPSLLENLKEIFSVPAIRRIGIIAIAVILLVVFFAATPIGRTIAESVIHYFVTLFDDGSLAIQREDDINLPTIVNDVDIVSDIEQDESDDTEDIVFLKSFDDFTEATGKTPFILPLPCTELYYEYDELFNYLALYSVYDTIDGTIIANQIWDCKDLIVSSLEGYSMYDTDETIYYSIEKDSGYVYCIKILENSVFTISSNGDFSLDDLIRFLKG